MQTIFISQRQNLVLPFLFIFLFFGLLVSSKADGSISVSFFDGDYSRLIEQAKKQNKPYFINFYTDWCSPCQSMNKFTYGNEELVSYVNEHFLALSVNAESEAGQGQMLADRYKVIFFPTIIIFSPEGELLHKFTGYKNANDLLTELKKYGKNQPLNAPISLPTTENKESMHQVGSTSASHVLTANISEALAETETAPKEAFFNSSTPTRESIQSQSSPTTRTGSEVRTPITSTTQTRSNNNELFKISLIPQESKGFGVQTGVFANYENVMKEVAKLEDSYRQDVLVSIQKLNGQTLFKVMVGPFPTYGHARKFTTSFERDEKREAIILNLDKR